MDRFAAMLILLGCLVSTVLIVLALFAVAPIVCSCLLSLFYSLYLFMAYEESGVHHAQEFENRFWTIFAGLLSTALIFAHDSPFATIGTYSPSLGFIIVVCSGYAMHLWDRHLHRIAISQSGVGRHLRRTSGTTSSSLLRLEDMGISISAQLEKINSCLTEIDQLLIPSTINNFINQRFVLSKEREIIKIIEECDARALNYLISHVKLGLLFYKIKDHHNFNGKNRTELITLFAVERLQILTVVSRVILLHSLQLLKLRANPRAEFWVQNILLNTHQDDLSELKTLTDAKGDYFSMNKLIYDDIRSESVRQTILSHFRREAAVQQTYIQMGVRRKNRVQMQWRKVLSDVDDTLLSSGGMYPAGVDKRYAKKTVYPGVLAFYRELDLGTVGPDEWDDEQVGNLVFLSARPHVYRDISEKQNFAKFELLRANTMDGRKGLHTTPSLLSGDLSSGSQYVMTNDFEPLAQKKVDNFRRYVSIYPEYKHIFVCDNGQGDVRAAEIMFNNFPYEFEGAYVHIVQDISRTYGYNPSHWREKEFKPFFFRCYPEAALHAASRNPPLIRLRGLQRICQDSVKDFLQMKKSQFNSEAGREERRSELNQAIWMANNFLIKNSELPVDLIKAEQRWGIGEKVRTPYGIAIIQAFDSVYNIYDVLLDWRPLDVQVAEYTTVKMRASTTAPPPRGQSIPPSRAQPPLSTVEENDDEDIHATEVQRLAAGNNVVETDQAEGLNSPKQEVGESSAECSASTTLRAPHHSLLPEPRVPAATTAPLSTMPNTQQVSDIVGPEDDTPTPKLQVRAQVYGKFISKYIPPSLPILESKKKVPTSLFPFLTKTPEKAPIFRKGSEVSTPYGPGVVAAYREKSGIVVVDMVGWVATGYFQEGQIKHRIPKSLLSSILRQLSSGVEGQPKQLEFPFAIGTPISTPFGQAKVIRPLVIGKSLKVPRIETIGLRLESWKLSNGSHPTLYCTVETAQRWKDKKPDDGISLMSTFNTLVSSSISSSRTLFVPFLAQTKKPIVELPKVFKRFYKDAAAVSTRYGNGRVLTFRESDGFYEVSLSQWILSDGKTAKAYLKTDDMTYRIRKDCHEGCHVLTSFGLTGKLASIEPTTGVYIVTMPSAGLVCYLQPESIIRPVKAKCGDRVVSQYGEGEVYHYNPLTDIYSILLTKWNAKLYGCGNSFDRINDGVAPTSGSVSGVDWLFNFWFFRPPESATRSRSNSVVSGTQSSRSVG